jgi:hypothetical protein
VSAGHTNYERWPLYWFALFEAALEAGDLDRAADAQHRLEGLGLRVEPLAPWVELPADDGGAEVGR